MLIKRTLLSLAERTTIKEERNYETKEAPKEKVCGKRERERDRG
jgi:hypothetical protein